MRTLISAEVASNHGGDIHLAKEFIRVAAEAGVDYVKFQSWRAARMRDGPRDPQYAWFVQSELSDSAHVSLIDECNKRDVKFLTTLFDKERVDFVASLGLKEVKIASPDANNYELLEKVRERFSHVILSTGLSSDEEIAEAVVFMKGCDITLCHCISVYPIPPEGANMDRIDWLRTVATKVGYSDHTRGTEAAKVAIAKRVHYLEKHFCLGRNGPGRVCPWDATPEEMHEIVQFARSVERLSTPPSVEISEKIRAARHFYIGRFGRKEADAPDISK
jgi:N,N'-diacetyllegionaminate synthase